MRATTVVMDAAWRAIDALPMEAITCAPTWLWIVCGGTNGDVGTGPLVCHADAIRLSDV